MASNEALARLVVTIGANIADFARAMQQTQSKLSSFVSGVSKIAGTIGVAFGVSQVAGFALEISRLAGEAEGVKAAFDRLPNSVRVMRELKEATGGTVSELDLMKAAVQAKNFQIPIENLGSLFKFATLRAQQTGQSVDYLVQSIILGIGRKSPLILDNLGISAIRLREKLKGVSTEAATVGDVAKVVGDIAKEELGGMAGFSDNAATKIQQLSAKFEDFKVQLGKTGNETGLLADAIGDLLLIIQNLTDFLKSDASQALGGWLRLVSIVPRYTLKAGNAVLEYKNSFNTLNGAIQHFNDDFKNTPFPDYGTEGKEALDKIAKLAEAAGKKIVILRDDVGKTVIAIKNQAVTTVAADDAVKKQIVTLESLQEQLKQLNDQFEKTDVSDRARLILKGQEIISIDKQIKKLNELRKAQVEYQNNLTGFKAKLAEVTKALEDTNSTDTVRINLLRQEKQALEQLVAAQQLLNSVQNESITTQTRLNTAIQQGNFLKLADAGKLPSLFTFNQEDVDKMIAAIRTVKLELIDFQNTTIDISGQVSGGIANLAAVFGQASVSSKDFGKNIVQAAAGFAQEFGAILIAAGVAKIAFSKFNGPLMIAAGAALVALGAAASAAISSRPSLSGSESASSNSSSATGSATGGLLSIIGDGEWKISGRDLVYVYDKNKGLDGSRRG